MKLPFTERAAPEVKHLFTTETLRHREETIGSTLCLRVSVVNISFLEKRPEHLPRPHILATSH